MSHNFTSGCWIKGTGKRFWHGLGSEAPTGLTPQEYFRLGGALFEPFPGTIQLASTGAMIPGYQAIVHNETSEVLSIQSNDYKVISNLLLLELVNALREEIELISVAVMGGGRRVAFSARIKSLSAEIKGDPIEMKLSGVNSFDGSQAFSVLFDPTRIECDNTMGMAVSGADRRAVRGKNSIIRVTHRSGAEDIIRQIPGVIDFANARFTATIEEVEAMVATPCDNALFKRMLEITFADELRKPINDVRGDKTTARPRNLTDIPGFEVMVDNFKGAQPGANAATNGTVWGGLNAISAFYRHSAFKGGVNSDERRFGSLQCGINQLRVQRAHAAALELTRA
jgi:hypothetical protein